MGKNTYAQYHLWEKHILAWKASGLTRKGFCEKNGIKVTTVDYYRKRIASRHRNGFIEVTEPAAAGNEPIHIRIREGFVIEVRKGFDSGLLANILRPRSALATVGPGHGRPWPRSAWPRSAVPLAGHEKEAPPAREITVEQIGMLLAGIDFWGAQETLTFSSVAI